MQIRLSFNEIAQMAKLLTRNDKEAASNTYSYPVIYADDFKCENSYIKFI